MSRQHAIPPQNLSVTLAAALLYQKWPYTNTKKTPVIERFCAEKTLQTGAADVVPIQKTVVAENSQVSTNVKLEKPLDELEIYSPIDLNGQTATLHMQFLGLTPGQEKNEIDSSPLLLVPTLQQSPSLQCGLLGGILSEDGRPSKESRIFYNVSCPSSIFICGSQGSGKSNTLACLLENCLIPSDLGRLAHPLAGIVFHYDTFASDDGGLPCEAAFLASHAKVSARVLCAPTSFRTVKVMTGSQSTTTSDGWRLTQVIGF